MQPYTSLLKIFIVALLSLGGLAANAQVVQMHIVTGQGQCVPLGDSVHTFVVDSFSVTSGPSNGTVSHDTTGGWLTTIHYCPNRSFMGTDSFTLYVCELVSGGIRQCNSYSFVATVTSGCTFVIGLLQDSATTCPGGNRSFSIVAGGYPNAPYTYQWSDGSTGSAACEPAAGQPVCVTVTDIIGCTATACSNDTSPCNILMSFTTLSACPPGQLGVEAYTSNTTGPCTYSWSGYPGVNTSYLCGVPSGLYSFTITDSVGCSATGYYTIRDTNIGYCQAYFYNYIDSADTNTFHFIDYSSYHPVSWSWDFGDSTTSTLQNPVHTFTTPGAYTVCLSTTDSSGCQSNYCNRLSNVPIQDVAVLLFHQTTVTPGFPVWVDVSYFNAGTINMSGTIQYRYPVGTIITASSLAPVSNDTASRLATFSFSNLLPGSADNISISLIADTNLQIGTLAEDTAWISPTAGDMNVADNISFVNDTVTGSWDPNEKSVSPKGEGREGIVPTSTKEVSYIIHFQNTGNGPAQKVVVVDTLDSNIDWSTVQETAASHDHVTQLTGNVMTVTFHNINLPDSGTNLAASQGYVMLLAQLNNGLPANTRIANKASIYFDFNAAVMTNTVVTTLLDKTSGIGNIQRFDFSVVPNPAYNVVTLCGEFGQGTTYEIVNQLGQVLMTGEVKVNSTNLNISRLSGGIYLVKVISGDKVGIQRLTVTR